MRRRQGENYGFTLIELSIVLVIIGLIVGGVLVGQDLINAAATRAQIAQIEKYNTAVNAFRSKYTAIPGDLSPTLAAQFGFNVGAGCDGVSQGWRNQDGLLDGFPGYPLVQSAGEVELFWQDLSTANMIDGTYPNGGVPAISCSGAQPGVSATQIGLYLPAAKIGKGNYLYVYENAGFNWFGLSSPNQIPTWGALYGTVSISVSQAYNLDKKIDDSLPTSGTVQAVFINGWVAPGSTTPFSSANAASDSATTCYNSATNTYSTQINGGSGPNCGLSFRMQGAAR